jgi:hypothetical protein
MQSRAATVSEYLAELPEDRRRAIETLRRVILDNIDPGFEERMGYGMPGWVVPHSVFPAGYHCDPEQPLPFAGLASQKQHLSLYMMGLYTGPAADGLLRWFKDAWAKSGKKPPDMGKACIRFKRIEDVPLEVIGEAFRRLRLKDYVAGYEAALAASTPTPRAKIKEMVAKRKAARVPKKAAGTVKKKASTRATGKTRAKARKTSAKRR